MQVLNGFKLLKHKWRPQARDPQVVPRISLWRYKTIELSHSFVPCEAEALKNTCERESY